MAPFSKKWRKNAGKKSKLTQKDEKIVKINGLMKALLGIRENFFHTF